MKFGRFFVYALFLGAFCLCAAAAAFAPSAYAAPAAHADGGDTPARRGLPSDGAECVNLPVVMYHSTHDKRPGKYNIPPAQFERDVVYLLDKGYTPITVADLSAYSDGGDIAKKPVMLTFDDGYMNNYFKIYPIIKKYKVKCVMFVIGVLTDANYRESGGEENRHPLRSHLTYEQMREMRDSGLVEIQNHTYNMHKLARQCGRCGLKMKPGESAEEYERTVSADLLKMQGRLTEKLGITPTAVAYPFGAYCRQTPEVLRKLNFRAGFTCNEHQNKIKRGENYYLLGRYNRPYGPDSASFFKKMSVV